MAKQQVLRIRLQAYDHKILDVAVQKIVEIANHFNVKIVGPVPLPTEKQVYTILRATFKYKDSREQSGSLIFQTASTSMSQRNKED